MGDAPNLRQPDWSVIGEGFGAVVWRSADERRITRVARTAPAGRALERQVRWLPRLAPHLPVAIPSILWSALPSRDDRFPHGAMMYKAIPGRPLESRDISLEIMDAIVGFLVALHDAPMPEDADGTRWHDDLILARDATFGTIQETLRDRLTPAEFAAIMDWHAIPPPETSYPVVIHGDFWHENILVDHGSGKLRGVIDWEAVTVGHPSQDLVTLRYLGHEHADRIAADYAARTGRDLDDLTRDMAWFWEARDFGGIAAAVEMEDAGELADAIRKLRAGPILRADRRR